MRNSDQHPERRQQILEAASRVFSQKGYSGTTNSDIAAEAGVTTGLIYWYFENKEALFEAVLEAKSPLPRLTGMAQESFDKPPREFFTQVASLFVNQSEEAATSLRLLIADALRTGQRGGRVSGRLVSRAVEAVAGYLRHQAATGTVRPVDPQVSARLFVGLLTSQLIEGLLSGEAQLGGDRVQEVVDTFFKGVLEP